jgi:hypothetical protein
MEAPRKDFTTIDYGSFSAAAMAVEDDIKRRSEKVEIYMMDNSNTSGK